MGLHYQSKEQREKERGPHPVWRGIGCIMMLFIPLFSFAASMELIPYMAQNVRGFGLPAIMMRPLSLIPGITIKYFLAVMGLAIILSLGLFAIMAVANAIIYSMSGAYTLRRFEAPPVRRKKSRKKRFRR